MKVKFTAEITMDIPGEFQNDALAVNAITRELEERLDIGCEYEDDMSGELVFRTIDITQYVSKIPLFLESLEEE